MVGISKENVGSIVGSQSIDDRLHHAAELLLAARRDVAPIADLPTELRPMTMAEAYRLQGMMSASLGTIGGWKVGAPTPDSEPLCAPMPLWGGYARSGEIIGKSFSRLRAVEAEIAFLLGKDLPVREAAYSRKEVIEAIASAHPAIEILESAFEDPSKVDRFSAIGDLQLNGGFAYGEALPGWQEVDLTRESAVMIVDGAVRVEGMASNPGGPDLLRLVTWLANEGQSLTGGLKAGEWITSGSWTGKTPASAGSEAIARFTSFGEVRIYFAS